MKIVSWNVNGLRAVLNKGFEDFLYNNDIDILCVQETKMQEDQVTFSFDGYEQYFNSAVKKGYSGTAIFTKIKPLSVSYGMGIEEHDQEGRITTLEFDNFYLVCVYVPNSQTELKRLDYRMKWEDDFKNYLHSFNKNVIVCGDLNVAHEEIDIKNPKTNTHNAGFTIEERNKMTSLLDSGFIDTFRYFYPDTVKYSWWSYRFNARKNNTGWRIDYFLTNKENISNIKDAFILDEVMGSDHCPVGIIL